MMHHPDPLRDEYTIETPESVAFGYEVAGIGSRSIGALIDALLLALALVIVNIVLLTLLTALGQAAPLSSVSDRRAPSWIAGLLLAAYALVNFALVWGYFVLFELLWNGQTPGKRIAGTRVVRPDGSPASVLAIVIRNLVRIIDFLPGFYGFGLVTMFFNRRSRRLGDLAAGTLVIREGRTVGLASLRSVAPADALDTATVARLEALARDYNRLRALTAADYDLIADTLARRARGAIDGNLVTRLARALATKLGGPLPADAHQFLSDLATHYRRG